MMIEFVFTEFFTLLITLVFLIVATSLAGPVTSRPKILNSLPPLVNLNLSAVKISNPPELLMRTYLSSSYGRNVSFSPA